MSCEVVAEVVRSGLVESRHYGVIVALEPDGSVAWSVGKIDEPMFPRSGEQARAGRGHAPVRA